MINQNLYFNIITFDYPKEEQLFYFSEYQVGNCCRIHKSLFPNDIEDIMPGITTDGTNFIYTTFAFPKEGFTPLDIDFKTEKQDLLRRYYNRRINYYFRNTKSLLVRTGFIGENQVWVYSEELSNDEFDVYLKFSIKIQFKTVSDYPELQLSYDGKSKVFKLNSEELSLQVSQSTYKWLVYNNQLISYEDLMNEYDADYTQAYPVLNIDIVQALKMPAEPRSEKDKYNVYRDNIKSFYADFLNNEEFKSIIPLHDSGFLKVPVNLIGNVPEDSSELQFKYDTGKFPKTDFRLSKPFEKVKGNVHLFFIYHKNDQPTKDKLQGYFERGLDHYKGLTAYAGILFHTDSNLNICFENKSNPLPEIEAFLNDKFDAQDGIKYLAVYLTPFSKEETRHQEVRVYARIKQQLIKRKIACQFVEPETVEQPNNGFKWSLTTMSVAILAKLGGIPWRLTSRKVKRDLIVGVGAFRHPDGVQYVSSAFSFENTGKFREFDYFMRYQTDVLAGNIAAKVKEFASNYGNPSRLIIHFYKQISEEEIKPIEAALKELELPNPIPIFIVTINKTYTKDIVAFSVTRDNPYLMPYSGTYINIGNKKYLLFNSSRHQTAAFSDKDGVPFPIKLTIECTVEKLLDDAEIIKEMIDQVYQFSRMYWKSLTQQSIPVTVSYPAMVAEVAPYFEDGIIPEEGKDNLWFL